MANQRSTVVGVFSDPAQARAAVGDLRNAGFREDQIGLIAHDTSRTGTSDASTDQTGTQWEEGSGIGAAAGAATGLGLGAAVAAGLIPGVGPVIAGGTLMALIASAGAGAAVGTVLGGLVGLGVPEEEATYYEGEFKAGRTLVTVKAGGKFSEVEAILRRHGAYDMHSAGKATTAATAARATTGTATATTGTARAQAGQTVQLKEEVAHVEKQPVQTGEVRVSKEVVTEQKTMNVPVTREEVVIERHPVSGQRATSGEIRAGEEVRIPVREERVSVNKDTVVAEEVSVGKKKVQDTETVAANVKKERLKVDEAGDVTVRGDDKTKGR